jgi:hypothetical protein
MNILKLYGSVSQRIWRNVWNNNRFNPSTFSQCACPKNGTWFGVQWFEARGGIRFVDIGGIVVHLFLDILFIIVVRSVVIDTKYGQSYQFGSQTWWGVYSIHYLIKKNCCSVTCYRSLHGSLLVLLYSMHYVHGSKIITFVHRIIPVSFHCLATWCIM